MEKLAAALTLMILAGFAGVAAGVSGDAEVRCEVGPLDRLVSRLLQQRGEPALSRASAETAAAHAVTLCSSSAVTQSDAGRVLGFVLDVYGLRLEPGVHESRLTVVRSRSPGEELRRQAPLLTLHSLLDRFAEPIWAPHQEGHAGHVVLRGERGMFHVEGAAPTPEQVETVLRLLNHPRPTDTGELELRVSAPLADALEQLASDLGWTLVFDARLFPRVHLTASRLTAAEARALARSVILWNGLELRQHGGSAGLAYVFAMEADAGTLARIPPEVLQQLARAPQAVDLRGFRETPIAETLHTLASNVDLPLLTGRRARALPLTLVVPSESVLETPRPPSHAALLEAFLTVHDLVLRENRAGQYEASPRVLRADAPRSVPGPHPLLRRSGVHPGDRIVSIAGTPKSRLGAAQLRLESGSIEVEVEDPEGVHHSLSMPARALTLLLAEYGALPRASLEGARGGASDPGQTLR